MNRPYTTRKITVLVLTLFFILTGIAFPQTLSGLSGKVVDHQGKPVAGFMFAIQPMQLHDNYLQPAEWVAPPRAQESPETIDSSEMARVVSNVQTDPDGTFTLMDIQPGLVQLRALPNIPLDKLVMLDNMFNSGDFPPKEMSMRWRWRRPDKRILSIQIGKVTCFHIGDPDFFEDPTFALEPGVILENIIITVKPRLRIHGRLVSADGTSLANIKARVSIKQSHETRPNHNASIGTDFFTDANGYFTHYTDEPGFYTLSVQYNDLSAGVGPFLLKDGVQPKEIVLTLGNKQVPVEPSTDDIKAPGNIEFRKPPTPPPVESVWVINPTNGHAYKKIQCEDWNDAQRKAVAEDAHLVSINDEAEQHWLQVIFSGAPFWIGLTDLEKEGEWQWDTGEPTTYTNWSTEPIFPDRLPDAEKDHAVFTFRAGEWQSVGPESHFWRMARQAVIEKDGLISNIDR